MQKDSLYCILFLHQTTTYIHGRTHAQGLYCILFLHQTTTANRLRISIYSLYCILFLHQTTTPRAERAAARLLYCILFLHQTTTPIMRVWGRDKLYCILFLHQTTTGVCAPARQSRCIASSFYIKPNTTGTRITIPHVVLHPLSTSNHNMVGNRRSIGGVVLHPLSTSNHNPRTPDTLIFGHLTASRHDTKRGGVHRGSRFDAVFTFSTNIRKIIFTEIRRCMSVQRAGARLRSDSSEANI